jgi:RNA polymerase sigma factor (sigma-70 family)
VAHVSGDDVLLVRRCLRGDPGAMEQLVGRYQADVFGLCVRHRQDAEDVTQEVFLRVFRSLRGWDSSRPLRPWIMGITVNRCRTWMAQRSRRPEPVDYLHEAASREVSDDGAELAREIAAAVRDLRLEYQSVFALFHEQGLPYEDIARALRKPVGTIKTWLHRARLEVLDRLRKRGMISEVGHELP